MHRERKKKTWKDSLEGKALRFSEGGKCRNSANAVDVFQSTWYI